jgi:hypothetical protein
MSRGMHRADRPERAGRSFKERLTMFLFGEDPVRRVICPECKTALRPEGHIPPVPPVGGLPYMP